MAFERLLPFFQTPYFLSSGALLVSQINRVLLKRIALYFSNTLVFSRGFAPCPSNN